MLKPIQKKSVSDAVFEQLRDQIVSGTMEAGETLPSERVLADMLQVNRGAVREALKRLEQARLVAIQHGGSTRVLDFQKTAGTELLAELLIGTDGDLRLEVVVGMLELRSALGADIARRCAERTPEAGTALLKKVQKMGRAKSDLFALRDLDMEFWAIIVEGSKNVAYQLVFNSIYDIYEKLGDILSQVFSEELRDIDGHKKLAESVAEGRVDDAEFYARDLSQRSEQRLRAIAMKVHAPK